MWGGLAGSILLLMRSRWAVWAFGLSLLGAVLGLGYQIVARTAAAGRAREADDEGDAAVIIVIAVAAFLLWYARNAEKKGVLR